ncbi:Hypp9586 [Branchiostoma lanceolatum]|uniref:Hypp9586 protein n=1 Tax=Branchiostoma lanceolatum TaxID=7740 RepID=A0A8S4MPB0_BRALA|nr:Hypp9586 [Branchiostoma lanceolatum]
MAASPGAADDTGEEHPALRLVQAQFMAMVPIRFFRWKLDGDDKGKAVFELEDQQELLQMTVHHPLIMRYPTSLSYRQAFLKYIIQQCEDAGQEVCDELYEVYTSLLVSTLEPTSPCCYKTYTLTSLLAIAEARDQQLCRKDAPRLAMCPADDAVVFLPHRAERRNLTQSDYPYDEDPALPMPVSSLE